MPIQYIKGNLFDHLQPNDLICHVVNDIYKWGSGFVVPLGERFPEAKEAYLNWKHDVRPQCAVTATALSLGHVQFVLSWLNVKKGEGITIVNMCAQKGVRSKNNPHPLDYSALSSCMYYVLKYCSPSWAPPFRIIAPKFGAGLAGGDWTTIEKMIEENWKDLPVIICEL